MRLKEITREEYVRKEGGQGMNSDEHFIWVQKWELLEKEKVEKLDGGIILKPRLESLWKRKFQEEVINQQSEFI